MFRADRQAEGHDEADSSFPQFCEHDARFKVVTAVSLWIQVLTGFCTQQQGATGCNVLEM